MQAGCIGFAIGVTIGGCLGTYYVPKKILKMSDEIYSLEPDCYEGTDYTANVDSTSESGRSQEHSDTEQPKSG